MKKTSIFLACLLTSSAASAGVIVNIRVSREVPEMVAEVSWGEPVVDKGTALAPSATPKAILWQSSVTVTQQAQ